MLETASVLQELFNRISRIKFLPLDVNVYERKPYTLLYTVVPRRKVDGDYASD